MRRIKKVNIPGLPQSPTTLLTVITQTSTGDRKAYSFRVAVSSGSPKYSQVIITPDAVETKTALSSLPTQNYCVSQAEERRSYGAEGNESTFSPAPLHPCTSASNHAKFSLLTTRPQLPSLITNLETVNSIRKGIAISIRNKTLTPNNELHQRLKKLLTYLQQGDELTTASTKAVVSMELVNKLIDIGK